MIWRATVMDRINEIDNGIMNHCFLLLTLCSKRGFILSFWHHLRYFRDPYYDSPRPGLKLNPVLASKSLLKAANSLLKARKGDDTFDGCWNLNGAPRDQPISSRTKSLLTKSSRLNRRQQSSGHWLTIGGLTDKIVADAPPPGDACSSASFMHDMHGHEHTRVMSDFAIQSVWLLVSSEMRTQGMCVVDRVSFGHGWWFARRLSPSILNFACSGRVAF